MAVSNRELLQFFDQTLKPDNVKDYCPNGLQIEGKPTVGKLVCGVTASQALIDAAVELGADALFVHHGYFWKGEEPCVTGIKKRRLQTLLTHDINLYAYHLPLDIHPQLGNNAQLAELLEINVIRGLEASNPHSVAMLGEFNPPKTIEAFLAEIETVLQRKVLAERCGPDLIRSVAWCTGGGQGYIEMAARQGVDLFLTGEVSEQTIHTARECQMHFVAAGHHATERYGAKAMARYVQEQLDVEAEFIDIDNLA